MLKARLEWDSREYQGHIRDSKAFEDMKERNGVVNEKELLPRGCVLFIF